MEPDIIVQEESGDGVSITLKSIWNFIKLSAVRVLLYTLAMLIVATGAVIVLNAAMTSESMAQGAIEFVYEGADRGLLPGGNERLFERSEIIGVSVLDRAVQRAGLGPDGNGKISNINTLRGHFSVQGAMSAEYLRLLERAADGDEAAQAQLINFEFFPTRFSVQLRDARALELTRREAADLADAVLYVFRDDFMRAHTLTNRFSAAALQPNFESFEFFNQFDILAVDVQAVLSYLAERNVSDAAFRSVETGLAFSDLLARGSLVTSSINGLNAFINTNPVADNLAAQHALFESMIDLMTEQAEFHERNAANLRIQLDSFAPNTTIIDTDSGRNTIVTFPQLYFDLQRELTAESQRASSYRQRIGIMEVRSDAFYDALNGSGSGGLTIAEARGVAVQLLNNINAATNEFAGLVNSTLAEFYERDFNQNMVRIVQPAAYITLGRSSMVFVYIFIAAAVMGAAAGMIVTQVKRVMVQRRR